MMKLRATELMRRSINDAMDIHGGKTVIDGPKNYLGDLYRAIPIGITVEGANILTRNLMVFGQGSIRCHPWLLKEMLALEEKDPEKSLNDFDEAFWSHVGHSFKNMWRATIRSWSLGFFSPVPLSFHGKVWSYYKQLGRYTSSFALLSDAIILTMQGSIKRREMLSARLGDIFTELYFLSATLKRWEDEGKKIEDLPLVKYCMEAGFANIESCFNAVLRNMPNRIVARFVKLIIQPFGQLRYGPMDTVIKSCAEILLSPSESRDRLTSGLYYDKDNSGVTAQLESAFILAVEVEPIRQKMKDTKIFSTTSALQSGLLTTEEVQKLEAADKAAAEVIAVDDFQKFKNYTRLSALGLHI